MSPISKIKHPRRLHPINVGLTVAIFPYIDIFTTMHLDPQLSSPMIALSMTDPTVNETTNANDLRTRTKVNLEN